MTKARAASLALVTPAPSLFDVKPSIGDQASSRGSDRRIHARLTPVELQRPLTARLKYGEDITLVDLSAGGALVETSKILRPDTDLVLEILDSRTSDVTQVVSRVLRSQVSGLSGGVKYRGACVFKRPFSHPALVALPAPPPLLKTDAGDFLKLEFALKTIVEGYFKRPTTSGGAGRWRDGSALLDALVRLRAAAERRESPIDRQLAQLLAAIMGHNLCLDIFGGPSDEEAAAGFGAHGEASVVAYEISAASGQLTMQAPLPEARLHVERRIELRDRTVYVHEAVENLAATDRPVGWTEHVTLGPPFLEKGVTEFRASATRSKVFESVFGPADYLTPGAEFEWPSAPRAGGGAADLRVYTAADASGAFTTHLMDPGRPHAFFVAFSPRARLALGYVWKQSDFPWMGIWEENRSRANPPWNGQELTRGMEFGVSPFPESRRRMIDRSRLFGVPTYRWIPAKTRVDVEYRIVVQSATRIPEVLEWPG